MKLSPKIILRTIEQHLANPLNFSLLSTDLFLTRPVFLTNQTAWPTRTICIAEEVPSSLMTKKIPDTTVLLTKQSETTGHLSSFRQCFFLKSDCSLPDLFNCIQNLYNFYDDWDEKLHTMLYQEDTVQNLLDLSFPIFKNPLLLRQADFFLLAHSGIIDENQELAHIIDPVNSYDTITACKTDPIYLNSISLKTPYYLPAYLSGNKELCCNLFDHGIFSHRLILVEELEPIPDELGPLLVHLSHFIHKLLHQTDQNHQAEAYPLEDLLKDIISKKQTDYTIINAALSEYGWFSTHRYCCMLVKMSSLSSQNVTSNYLCRHFEEIIPGSCAFRYNGELIVFINLSRYDSSVDGLLNNITVFLRDSFLKTGISNSVIGSADLRYCYKQAKIAMDYGSRYQSFRWVHKFDDITMKYFMECCLKDLPVHMACSSKLLTLKEYDKTHNSDYFTTLKVYLESHLNAVQASRRLFIHRSTFLYRLEKIQDLVNINFDDLELLFYLMISYHILDLNIPNVALTADLPSGGN